jgi:hypothetical protein
VPARVSMSLADGTKQDPTDRLLAVNAVGVVVGSAWHESGVGASKQVALKWTSTGVELADGTR